MIRQKIERPLVCARKYCLECNGSSKEVRLCTANLSDPVCPLWPLRFGKKAQGVSTIKAIRARCLDCRGGSTVLVRDCKDTDCALWPYRMGTNPNRQGIGGQQSKKTPETTAQNAKISQK